LDLKTLERVRGRIFVFLHYFDFENIKLRPEVFIFRAEDVQRLKEQWMDNFGIYFSNPERRARIEKYKDRWDFFDE